uniref:Kinetochore scaffold 1 n=1 Tax=Anas platyrhynchos platyrhynchos TaxID=8840 RepID=A0A493TL95_ANAPP
MDKIYTDPNMENDNTEHMRRRRLSSILKAPRNPLDDLGNGNELTQDINIEKRRKNSRRVSFANTINCRVFQRDLKNNAAERENEECAADTGNHVLLNQNEEPEDVPCEITGMNTLLHAPIQALVQQTECHDVDNATQRTNRHDTTLIFSDENEMEMTASHTAVIARNLKNNETDKTEKIDITSFLAGLNSNSGKAEMSKEFHFSVDPTNRVCPSFEQKEDATAVKKINFNEFLIRLKSNEKALNPIEGPEKENLFCVSSQVSEDMARSSVESDYSHEPLATINVTKIFREQDDGMEVTKCQASDVKNMRYGICGAPPEQLPCPDVTEAFADDGMDMTTSHTAKMSFPFASVGNQSLNFKKDFPSMETDNYSVVKRASHQQLIVKQDPQLCTNKKTVNVEDTVDTTVPQTFKQETRALSAIPGSVSSETVFRGNKTVFSECGDMEITGNYTYVIYNENAKGMSSSCHKTFEKTVNTNSLPVESRHPALDDDTESLTSLDNRASELHKTNALEHLSGSDGRAERVTQDHRTASVDVGFDSCRNSVSAGTCKVFSGKDTALTKTCIDKADGKNVENEFPPGVSMSVTRKPRFLDNRISTSPSLSEQEKMEITKCQTVIIDDQSIGITAEAKQMHGKRIPGENHNKNVSAVASSLDRDKENLEAIGFDVNMKRKQPMEMNTDDVEVIIVNKKLRKTNLQASGLISCVKSVCSLQEQKTEIAENPATTNSAFMSLQSQEADITQPLKKTLQNASVSCTNDKTDVFSDDQNMDVTKAHSVAFEVAPINTVQEYENSHNQNNVIFKQLQKQISRFSNNSGVDPTAGQTAAIEYRDFKRSLDKQTVTPLSANGMFISSSETAPSGNTRNVQPAKVLGINADCQNSDRQVKTHTVKVVDNALPTREESERDFLISKTVSSQEDLKNPLSVNGLHSGIEEKLRTNTSEQQKRSSKLPSFSEKSVLFPSGENMDLTESYAAISPDQNIHMILPGRKAASVHVVEDENKTLSLKREVMMTINSQEQPGCNTYSLVSGKKMLTMTGLKHFVDEKTTIFSEDADMDITRSHTVSGENKIILLPKSSSNDIPFVSGDKTCVFTDNNDMEISRFDTVGIDKSVEKAAAGGMLSRANRTERKSSKGTTGEKTVLFSQSNEDNDMEITESHTAAIGHEIVSQKEVRLHSLSSAQPVKAVKFTSNQSYVDITMSCPADKITVKLLHDDNLNLNKEVEQDAPSNSDATVLPVDDMEITKTHNVTLEANSLWARQPNRSVPLCSTIIFTNDKADMEMTSYLPDDESTERVMCEDRVNPAKQVGQEALSGNKTVVFTSAEDMEITKTHTAVLRGDVWDRGLVPAISAVPADQTTVFPHKQDDMEITVSHTVAVNNNMEGFENQQVSRKSTRQPGLHSASLSACRDEVDSLQVKDLNEDTPDVRAPQDLDLATDNSVPVNSQQDLVQPGKLKLKRVPFRFPGIFQPKLPRRRNPSVSNVQDINAKSSEKVEALVSELNLNTGEAPDYTKSSRQNFSPSRFIAEEFLPICQEAMDSNDSVSFGSVEDGCNEINKRNISHNEQVKREETNEQIKHEETKASCKSTKRALEQDEEDLQSLKKLKAEESLVGGTSLDLQVTSGALSQSQVDVREGEDLPNLSAKNLDCTQANSSSSLDSVKADTELTIQRCSQMESQLLTDSLCEDNLWEKFQSGVITVGEFFTLLQVHIPIQKPRQSHLPANCAVSAPPTPEDLILSQYVYRPKLRIYEEDCQVLSQMIDELKQYVSVQDQPLVNVNKSLWEVMRTCSDEELKSFGAELNKMKSYFIKESKILAHNEKEALYSKLLQSAQEQYEKLQSRIANVDELLKEAESCLAELEADSEWEDCETDCSEEMAEEDSESKKLEEELASLKAQEEELERELSDLETENEQMFVQLKHLQEKEKSCEELLERYNFPEWEISEWTEQQAVFNFLYDSIELTVVFGPPIDGDVFGENPSRKIVSLSFESLLDEEKAPLFSCLVHRLVFQFIESQGCWQEKCPTLQYLPQVLHDVSLVVSRCRILGEEIEFLERWGGKFNLLKTDINDTNLKLLFSSSTAFAKFEVTLSLSSNYPATSLPFTVQKQIGNIGHEEISAVLSNVPVGYHYLRRMVSLIHQNLLQDAR